MNKTLYGSGFYHSKDGLTWPEYVHDKLKSEWSLSTTITESNLECYFLRHWKRNYFADQFLKHPDHIEYNDNKYFVRFHDSWSVTMKYEQIALSFRKPKPELNLPAYVLVKGIPNA